MSVLSRLLLSFIHAYQFAFSSFMGGCCRYYPSCSAYAAESVRRFGAGRGIWLALARILRCHPFCRGGHDPVPDSFHFISKQACRPQHAVHERSAP